MKILRTALVLALSLIGVQSAYAQATLLPPAEMCLSASTGITGSIGLLGSITGGSGYVAGSYGGVALTGGSGTGATANITVAGGIVTSVAVLNPGINYVVGDVLSASNANLGGAGSGFSFPVASIGINSNLAAGKIGFYVPGTLTFKTTWRNSTQTTPNTNPVTLDANGCAVIYGIGSYRMIVKDSLGNTVWDQVTTAPASSVVTTATSGAGDFLPLGAIIPISGFTAPTNYVLAFGQAISRTTYSDALAAITISSNASCTSGSATVSGITSTAQMRAGAPIESSCLAPGTTIATIASSVSVTVSVPATATASTTIKVFNWGNGDGSTTFNVPDLRGRVLAGPDSMGGSAASRLTSTYYGISAAPPSAASSAPAGQSQTILTANLPPYTPTGTNSTPAITISGGTIGGTLNIGNPAGGGSSPFTGAAISASLSGAPVFTGTAQGGASTPFSIVQPTLTINYAIKVLNGTLPITGVLSLGGMTGDILCGSGVTCTGGIITSDGSGGTLLTNNIFVGNASNVATGVALGGDCTIVAGTITCTKTGGVAFATSATTNTTNAANISSGILPDARLSTTIAAAGPIGDATHIPVITYDSHGRLTAVSTIATGALQAANNLSDLTVAATARTNLGLGTMATQAASAVAITGGTITGMPSPTIASDVAIKSYVDSIAIGLSLKQAVKYGTVAALAGNTYANGASGVGATLTENTNGAVSFDGSTPSAGDRVLVKNEATAANNGCYTVTAVGSGGAPYVLTRCTDLDTAAELVAGSAMLITNGATLANTGWALQSTVTTVGTTAANFAQYAGGSQWTNIVNDIYFANKVAIGSAVAPTFDLDVVRSVNGVLGGRVYNANSGSSAFADLIIGNDTTGTIGQLLVTSSTNTSYAGVNSVNLINGTNNPLGLGTNNTIRATIDGSGQFGIGTISPSQKFQVVLSQNGLTSGRIDNSNAGASAAASWVAGNGTSVLGLQMNGTSKSFGPSGNGEGIVYSDSPGLSLLAYGAAANLKFSAAVAGTEQMRLIGSSGALAIGTTTADTGVNLALRVGSGDAQVTNPSARWDAISFNGPGGGALTHATLNVLSTYTNATDALGHGILSQVNVQSCPLNCVGSAVGVYGGALNQNTVYPSNQPDMYGVAGFIFNIATVTNTVGQALGGFVRGYTAGTNNTVGLGSTSETIAGNHPSYGLFITASDGDNNNFISGASIVAARDFGFLVGPLPGLAAGGSDPTNPFAYARKSDTTLRFSVGNTGTVNSRGSDDGFAAVWVGRNNSNTITSAIRANGNFESITGTYGFISDRRVKSNIEPAPPTLEKFLAIPIRTFNKQGVDERLIGVIADEVQAQLPAMVYRGDDGYDRVNASTLFGPEMAKAFQEFVAETRYRLRQVEARKHHGK